MKNFFILLLCATNLFFSNPVHAAIIPITEPQKPLITSPHQIEGLTKMLKQLPDADDPRAIKDFLKKRLKKIMPANLTPEEAYSPTGISIVDVEEIRNKNKKTISAYEKIYNESMKKAGTMDTTINQDTQIDGKFYKLVSDTPNTEPLVPDFPYVKVKLTDKKEILAPANEHFPYILTTIEIEPTGLLRVTEEFIFISNNESFPEGFFRILPKYNYSSNGNKRRNDITLTSVTINKKEYPYKITEIGNYLHIEPQTPLNLPTGIYNYKFNYLLDRKIWHYDEFDEFYWDITANTLKNIVGSANAVVILPTGKKFMAQNAIVNTKNNLNSKRVRINYLAPNILGFADTEALDVGEDVHLYITLEKGTLLSPDFSKRYLWFMHDYGGILFAIFALLVILFSYHVSYKQIRHNQDKTNIRLKKTPMMFRYLNQNTFDKFALGAELLNLCSKNILSIQPKNDTAVLIKKTDDLKKLSAYELKLVNKLFPDNATALEANEESVLKLKRAYNFLKRTIHLQFNLLKLKLNSLYLLCGLVMLLIGEFCTSLLSVNPTHTFIVIFTCGILNFIYMVIYNLEFKKTWLRIIIKTLAIVSIILIGGWLSIYTSTLYALILAGSCAVIIYYTHLFSKRNGLLRNKIKETEELKSYLQKNPEFTETARDFNTKIPYILAFNLEFKYKNTQEFDLIKYFLGQISTNKSKGTN